MHVSSSMRATLRVAFVNLALLAAALAPASSQAPDFVSSHTQAASELVDMLRIEEQAFLTMRAAFSGASDANVAGAIVAEAMSEFLYDVVQWDTMRTEHIRVFQEQFTESELRELVSFYSTPTGRKLLERTPQMVETTSAAMHRMVAPHLPELQRRIMAALSGG